MSRLLFFGGDQDASEQVTPSNSEQGVVNEEDNMDVEEDEDEDEDEEDEDEDEEDSARSSVGVGLEIGPASTYEGMSRRGIPYPYGGGIRQDFVGVRRGSHGSRVSASKRSQRFAAAGSIVQSCWEQVKVNVQGFQHSPPGQRSLHVAVVHKQSLYMFGGYNGHGRVNQFHRFDFVNQTWQCLDADNGVKGTAPSARDRHSGVVISDRFLLFGGFDGLCRVNDLTAFSFEHSRWYPVARETADAICAGPSARHSHSAVAYRDTMYVFGGYDGAYKNDLHSLELVENCNMGRWRKIDAKGRYPQPRYRASCVAHENRLFLFGGHDGQNHLNCTHMFDLGSSTWASIHATGPPPLPRDSHTALVFNSNMFIFGGSSGNAMNDLHCLSLEDRDMCWFRVSTDGWSPCNRFCHVAVEYDNSMYVYGGYDGVTRLKDFHRFKFAPSVCRVDVPRGTLLEDLSGYVCDESMSDIVFACPSDDGDEHERVLGRQTGQFVYAHRIFCSRCPNLLSGVESAPRDDRGRPVLQLERGIKPEVFRHFLGYLYTDKASLPSPDATQRSPILALELYPLAQKYGVERLRRICLNFVSSTLTVGNAATVFQTSDRHGITDLRVRALAYILANFDQVSKTQSFEEMGRHDMSLVFEVLRKRGDVDAAAMASSTTADARSADAGGFEASEKSALMPEVIPVGPPLAPADGKLSEQVEELPIGKEKKWLPIKVNADNPDPGAAGPGKRSLHVVAVYRDEFYVFGGFTGEQRVSEFFKYNFKSKKWCVVPVSFDSDPPPCARDRHTAVVVADHFWVFAGYDGQARTNQLHAYSFKTEAWEEIAQGPNTPSIRHSHAATASGNSMFVFGGYDGSYKNDLYEFEATSRTWSRIECSGKAPTARYRTTLVTHSRNLYLFGGHDGFRHLDDVHVYNIALKHWSAMKVSGHPPIRRDSHIAVVHNAHMYVFGGSSGSAQNDFYKLRLREGGAWSKVHTTGMVPSPRFCHAAAVHERVMYVYGGYDGSQRLDDFIEWSFAESRISVVPRSSLIADLASKVDNPASSDVCFIVEDQRIYAHKIMCVRCPYFEAMFLGSMRESSATEVAIHDVRYEVFRALLLYLYTDRQEIALDMAMDLFVCADRFSVDRLKGMCENLMLNSIDVENVSDFLTASECHSATSLHGRCMDFIVRNFDEVSKQQSFEDMVRHNCELVIKVLRAR